MNKLTLIISTLILLISCGTSRLTENEAILLAEKYVLENGYTQLQVDSTIIQPDIVEQVMDKNGVIQLRRNTLIPKAVFQNKGLRRWTVGFQNKQDSTRFRIVRIYQNGKRIEMEHQDLKLITD